MSGAIERLKIGGCAGYSKDTQPNRGTASIIVTARSRAISHTTSAYATPLQDFLHMRFHLASELHRLEVAPQKNLPPTGGGRKKNRPCLRWSYPLEKMEPMPLADGIRFFLRLKLHDEGLMMEGRTEDFHVRKSAEQVVDPVELRA